MGERSPILIIGTPVARITPETKLENREKLLWSAADEFAREGLAAANINRISLAAGLAKGTVYNYFESKDALFLAVIEEGCKRAAQDAQNALIEGPTRERIEALLRTDIEWVRAHEPFAQVMVREMLTARPEFYGRILEASAPFLGLLVSLLQEGIEKGEVVGDVPAPQLALALAGLHDLALVQHWGTEHGWPLLDDIPSLVTRLFFDGAAPR